MGPPQQNGSTLGGRKRHSNFLEPTMTPDPALEAIRRARREISNDVDNDAARLIKRYQEMQAALGGRVVPGPEATPVETVVSSESSSGKSSTG